MIPLIILLVTYTLARVAVRRDRDGSLPGRIALSVMLIVTGTAHFTTTDALAAMVPPAFPAPVALVYATGVAEFAFALLLLLRPTPALGWALIAFFLAVLPANVYSAVRGVGMGDHGPAYLWFRVPLQVLFMAWAGWFTGAARMVRFRRRKNRPRSGRTAV